MQALNPAEAVRGVLGDSVQDVIERLGETTIVVDPAKIVEVCRYFRDSEGLEYIFLSDITAVDYYPQEPRFAVCYHLYSMVYNRRLRIKAYLASDEPKIATLTTLWPSANYQEREAFDLMGILFEGHPNMRRILMPEDWEGHPLRKDYPLGYEPVQFSFNYEDINRLKPYAKE
ncbi:MAG: NADH-quinone oxidoreductase subunit C [Chloroflexota bacterium]